MDDSARVGYDIILGRDLWTAWGFILKFSDHGIKTDDGPFKWSTAPMVDFGTYNFK